MEGCAQLLDEEGEVVLVVPKVGAGPSAWGRNEEDTVMCRYFRGTNLLPCTAEKTVHWNMTGGQLVANFWPNSGQIVATLTYDNL